MKICQVVQKLLLGDRPHFGVIDVTFNVISSIQNFIKIHQSVQTLSGVLCTLLRSLNARHFGMIEDTGLGNMTSRSSSMASPPYKRSSNSVNRFKSAPTSEV
jgi:hypothetical protein